MMKNKNIFWLLFFSCSALLLTSLLWAQQAELVFDRDPFISQLPPPPLPPPPSPPPPPPTSIDSFSDNVSYPSKKGSNQPSIAGDVPVPIVEIELPPLDIKGVVWGSNRPQAIINDMVVDEGQVIILEAKKVSGDQYSSENMNESKYLKVKVVKISKVEILFEYKEKIFKVKP